MVCFFLRIFFEVFEDFFDEFDEFFWRIFLFTKIGIRKIYEFPKRKFVKPCGEQLIFEKI